MQVAGSIAKVATGGNLINLCFKNKVAKVASVAGYSAHVRARNVFFTRAHQIVSRACTGGNTGNTGNFPVFMRVSEVATGGNLTQHTGNLPKEVEMLVSSHVTNQHMLAAAVSVWFHRQPAGRMFLMADIMQAVCGIDSASKDGERLAPVIARHLTSHGMTNKRMRGPQGNRHYWIK